MDAVKAEKRRAVLLYRRLRRAAALSRCLLEAVAAFSLLSWSSARLPAALALCAGFRQLPALLLHPLFAFLLGNAIVVTLVAKSSDPGPAAAADPLPPSPATPSPAAKPASSGVYDHHTSLPQHSHRGQGEAVYEDKLACLDSATTSARKGRRPEGARFQRTRSWDVAGSVAKEGDVGKLLRRSETDVGTLGPPEEEHGEEEVGGGPEDNDEFRRKIEAFIANQLRFIEEEEESLLLATRASAARCR